MRSVARAAQPQRQKIENLEPQKKFRFSQNYAATFFRCLSQEQWASVGVKFCGATKRRREKMTNYPLCKDTFKYVS